MEYTAVIRTLGKAGDKYKILIESLCQQTYRPKDIIVYIAEGYPIPTEATGIEHYVYVKKGMVAQRALPYQEVNTEWILFLDDDVYLPPKAVETLFHHLKEKRADIASPDVFPNSNRHFRGRIAMTLSGRMRGRKDDGKWAYKIMHTGGYSYNMSPSQGSYLSQTNAGPCFLARKSDFLKINFKEESWIEQCKYAQGEDQIMYYKMYCYGLKQLTVFDSGIVHLDAGTTNLSLDKEKNLIYADMFFKSVFWHRFIYTSEQSKLCKLWDIFCIAYLIAFSLSISCIKLKLSYFRLKLKALKDAYTLIHSIDYQSLSKIPSCKNTQQ